MMHDDTARLRAVAEARLIETADADEVFDNIARLAAAIFRTPVALVTVVEEHRQWFKARIGWHVTETPIEQAFCDHALRAGEPLIVQDATKDPRFANNPLVTGEPNIRFYCGVPVKTPEGHGLGTLCVIDRVPRVVAATELDTLRTLARQVEMEIEMRRQLSILAEVHFAERDAQRSRQLQVSMVVHDLRSPLTSMTLLAGLVSAADDASRESLRDIIDEAERMRRMLSDVLDISLHDVGRLVPRRSEVQVAPLVRRVAQRVAHIASRTNQHIEVALPHHPVALTADAGLLERVLDNLVTNAIHHGPPHATVRIAVEERATTVGFEVRDRNNVIPPDMRKSIFEVFERDATSAHRGYGLGLAFCKLAVEAHGGAISVEPNTKVASDVLSNDGGNCFAFELPRPVY